MKNLDPRGQRERIHTRALTMMQQGPSAKRDCCRSPIGPKAKGRPGRGIETHEDRGVLSMSPPHPGQDEGVGRYRYKKKRASVSASRLRSQHSSLPAVDVWVERCSGRSSPGKEPESAERQARGPAAPAAAGCVPHTIALMGSRRPSSAGHFQGEKTGPTFAHTLPLTSLTPTMHTPKTPGRRSPPATPVQNLKTRAGGCGTAQRAPRSGAPGHPAHVARSPALPARARERGRRKQSLKGRGGTRTHAKQGCPAPWLASTRCSPAERQAVADGHDAE